LGDIIEGKCLTPANSREGHERASLLMAFVASMPCHVARDGMLLPKHEVRATAAAMWVIKGTGLDNNQDSNNPPPPLAVKEVAAALAKANNAKPSLPEDWGTMDPQLCAEKPFRPAVASAFLYIPLLAWDLNTFAGALYSSLLLTGAELRAEDLLLGTKFLLTARLVQTLVFPHGLPRKGTSAFTNTKGWSEEEAQTEQAALLRLRSTLFSLLGRTPPDHDPDLLAKVSLAILPFARTVVLLLRATTSVSRQNQRKQRTRSSPAKQDKHSPADLLLDSVIYNPLLVTSSDGFCLPLELNGPMPSQLLANPKWLDYLKNWIGALRTLEAHHGNCGRGMKHTMEEFEPILSPAKSTTKPRVVDQALTSWIDSFESVSSKDVVDSVPPQAEAMEEDPPQSFHAPDAFLNELSAGSSDASENLDAPNNVDVDLMVFANNRIGSMTDDDDDIVDESSQEDQMDEDMEELMEVVPTNPLRLNVDFYDDSSDDEAVVDVEEDEEMPASPNYRQNRNFYVYNDDTSEESNRSNPRPASEEFAHVGKSAIIPYQSSLLRNGVVGPGPRGARFDRQHARSHMCDLSATGMIHRPPAQGQYSSLVRLPQSFVQLYSLVNRIKGHYYPADSNPNSPASSGNGLEDVDDATSSDTAICLLTGAVMRSGHRRPFATSQSQTRLPGTCTIHSRKVGSGIGIFFLVQKCTVLLVHNNKSAYSASLYVDEHGEEDPGIRRGRPLYLNNVRLKALETLWRSHGVPREVAQIRSTSDRVIRDNWY